jgi:hypothetical protein
MPNRLFTLRKPRWPESTAEALSAKKVMKERKRGTPKSGLEVRIEQ